MNHKKVKKQINKISTFYNSITADDDVSKIEKDLLLNYIRKLYEVVLEDNSSSSTSETTKAKEPKKEKPSSKTADVKEEVIEEVGKTPVVIERKPFEKAVEPKVTAAKEEIVTNPAPAAEVIQAVTASTPVAEVLDLPKMELSENMIAIFEQGNGNEISDRLGNLPIKDLTKSMGINERMFTVNELFGGDQELMKTVLSDLNGFKNFEEAKSYLVAGVAKDLEWDSASKYKKAINFVKLVQRRYS